MTLSSKQFNLFHRSIIWAWIFRFFSTQRIHFASNSSAPLNEFSMQRWFKSIVCDNSLEMYLEKSSRFYLTDKWNSSFSSSKWNIQLWNCLSNELSQETMKKETGRFVWVSKRLCLSGHLFACLLFVARAIQQASFVCLVVVLLSFANFMHC